MPIKKKLERRERCIYVEDAQTGRLLLAVSETFGLNNSDVMDMLHELEAKQAKPQVVPDTSTMLTVKGDRFNCDCSCKIFSKTQDGCYRCNACGTLYQGT